jgi:hypothetical protein
VERQNYAIEYRWEGRSEHLPALVRDLVTTRSGRSDSAC